ncbi:MAG: hypothetical protein ACREJO_03525 [Phycisphaerales bacterium]
MSDGGLWGCGEESPQQPRRSWTPTRMDCEQSGSAARVESLTAAARAYSPTPTVSNAAGNGYTRDNGDPMKPRPTLVGHVREGYSPTPCSSRVSNRLDTTCSGDGREKPNTLGWAMAAAGEGAARSPTPAANDAARGGETVETRLARGASSGVNLRQAINYSATPTGAKGGSTSRGGSRIGELLLGGQVRAADPGGGSMTSGSTRGRRYSSTPAAQDGGNTSLPPSQAERDSLPPSQAERDSLPGDLIRHGGAASPEGDGPSLCSPDSCSVSGNSPGSISAAWETQYMGYPDGWLEVSTSAGSWLSGTLSYRKRSPP